MTATTGSAGEVEKVNLVTVTIDGVEVQVPAGTLVIRAAEMIGVQIPRFCDHPLLDPVGACRQCLVEIPDAGNGRAMPKPQASCTIAVADGMVVNTQATSPVAAKAQAGNLEFLLINHPLDCPVCDKGGECPLQNQSMSNGTAESRFWANGGVKRVYPKPINISPQILLDRERCVLCARCTRFSEQIAGDPFIAMVERGAMQQVGTFDPQISGYSSPGDDGALTQEGQPFDSYFSGNTIQICPVGALTSADYRFRSRPFDLVSSPSIAEHDACGSAIRIDHRRGKVMRRLAGDDPEVNEEWITDKDRFAFTYARSADRLTHPQVRDAETGELRAASWPEAFAVAARGLQGARAAGVLTGGRLTAEDSYAYSKFARVALGTNDIDFRARVHSDEEERFLAAKVALNRSVSFTDLETVPTVLLVAFEPEDEAGAIFLRLRKGTRRGTTKVWSVGPFTTRGLHKLGARLIPARPGGETQVVAGLRADTDLALDDSAVILVGERAAEQPGLLTAVAQLADATGARLAWIPRRAGDRGAVETGALPHLFPGGRPVAEATARVDLAAAWGVDVLPSRAGRNTGQIIAAAAAGEIEALLVAGVDPADLPDPAAATAALERAFVVSLELRESAVTAVADVVFPVAPTTDRSGTFVNWEGRLRHFEAALHSPGSIPDLRVLAGIAEEMGRPIGIRTPEQAFADMTNLGPWDGVRPEFEGENAGSSTASAAGGGLVLASWKQSLDDGRMQDGEKYLRETARKQVVLAARSLLEGLGVAPGDEVVLTGPRGSLSLPIGVADLADGVVWAPATAPGASVRDHVGPAGSQVSIGLRTHVGEQA